MQANWWCEFFEGEASGVWHLAVPEAVTEVETAFVRSLFPPGARVLDVPCGDGRLSCALAAHGVEVTGVDLSAKMIGWARERGAGLPVQWHRADMRELPWTREFTGAFCLGNSFGYIGEAGDAAFLAAVHRTLQPGSLFALEALTGEAVFPALPRQRWYEVGGLLVYSQSSYDPLQGELKVDYNFQRGAQRVQATAYQRVRMAREVVVMLETAGFGEVQVFGGTDRSALGIQGNQRAIFVAQA